MGLFGFEKRWLLRIFDAVLPPGHGTLEIGARDVPLEGLIDDLFEVAPGQFSLGLRAATWVVTLFGPLLAGRLRTFGGLSREDRAAVLARLSTSRFYVLREIPMLLKMVACLGWGGMPEVQRRVGLEVVDETPPAWARRQP